MKDAIKVLIQEINIELKYGEKSKDSLMTMLQYVREHLRTNLIKEMIKEQKETIKQLNLEVEDIERRKTQTETIHF